MPLRLAKAEMSVARSPRSTISQAVSVDLVGLKPPRKEGSRDRSSIGIWCNREIVRQLISTLGQFISSPEWVSRSKESVQPSDGVALLVRYDACFLGGVFDDLDRLVIGSPVDWVWDTVFASVCKAVPSGVFP